MYLLNFKMQINFQVYGVTVKNYPTNFLRDAVFSVIEGNVINSKLEI